jgi:hypothetical protein
MLGSLVRVSINGTIVIVNGILSTKPLAIADNHMVDRKVGHGLPPVILSRVRDEFAKFSQVYDIVIFCISISIKALEILKDAVDLVILNQNLGQTFSRILSSPTVLTVRANYIFTRPKAL